MGIITSKIVPETEVSFLISDFVLLGRNNCTITTEDIDKAEAVNATMRSPNFSVTTPPIIGPAMIPREKAKPSLPKASALPENISLNLVLINCCY